MIIRMAIAALIVVTIVIVFGVAQGWAAGRCGLASWYGPESGETTASGARFRPDDMSAAMWGVPFGSRYRVTYRGKSVVVVILDRGPARRLHRLIDLSRGAARRIGLTGVGLVCLEGE